MLGTILHPRNIEIIKHSSPIFDHMHQAWNPRFYETPRKAILIGTVSDPASFSTPGPTDLNVNNMVLKLLGSDDVHLPSALTQFTNTIQEIIDYEYAININAKNYYAYLTVRQGWVKAGKTQSHPAIHVDGLQGAKYSHKLPPGQSYFVADSLPTRFFCHPFDFAAYNVNEYDYRTVMALQAEVDQSYLIDQLYGVYLLDPYMVHYPTIAPIDTFRTFLRMQFTQKQFVKYEDMDNPMIQYKSKKEGPHSIPANLKMLMRRDAQGIRYYVDKKGQRIDLHYAEDKGGDELPVG